MASSYLTRSFSAGNRKTFTQSFWVKLGGISAQPLGLSCKTADNTAYNIYIDSNSVIDWYVQYTNPSWTGRLITNRKFRDPNAWYHIVAVVDTTQATASDRLKLYVNGIQETSFSTETYPTQNSDVPHNDSANSYYVGAARDTGGYMNGTYAHFHFCDGYAYTPSDFGSTDATTGIWKPKTSPSVSYGTNGFFLKFENSGAIGTDSSSNGNNFSVGAGSVTQTQDTPSNVFCSINPVNIASDGNGPATLSNANLTLTSSGTSQAVGSLAVDVNSNSKWYYEFKNISGVANNNASSVGWSTDRSAFRSVSSWASYNSLFIYAADGDVYSTSGWVGAGTAPTYSNNDIIGCTVDLQNNEIKWYKNNTLAYTISSITWAGDIITPHSQWSNSGAVGSFNFGNGYFGSTAISSPNSDENGYGKFHYTPPTGFYSLCTKNINTYG